MMTSPKDPGKLEGLGNPLLDIGAQPTAGLMEAEHAALVLHFSFLAACVLPAAVFAMYSAGPRLPVSFKPQQNVDVVLLKMVIPAYAVERTFEASCFIVGWSCGAGPQCSCA